MEIIINEKDYYNAIRIIKRETFFVVQIVYNVPNNETPVYMLESIYPTIQSVYMYIDILFDHLWLDDNPPKSIDLQSNGFPCIVLNESTFKKPNCKAVIKASLEHALSFKTVKK